MTTDIDQQLKQLKENFVAEKTTITNSRYDAGFEADRRGAGAHQALLLGRSAAALERLRVVGEAIDHLAGAGMSVPIYAARDTLSSVIDDLHLAIGGKEQLVRAKEGHIEIVSRDLEDANTVNRSLADANVKLLDRATPEWSEGQDKRIYQLEEGLRQLARDGVITRGQKDRIIRAGVAALNKAAGIGAAE